MWIRRYEDTKLQRYTDTRFSGPDPLVSFTLWNTLENHFDSLPSHTQDIFDLIESKLGSELLNKSLPNCSPEII